jgi:hypothetical protein
MKLMTISLSQVVTSGTKVGARGTSDVATTRSLNHIDVLMAHAPRRTGLRDL